VKKPIELIEIYLECKKREIVAQQKMREWGGDSKAYSYFSGKVQAFSEIWEYIRFDGDSVPKGTVTPEEYNKANNEDVEKIQG